MNALGRAVAEVAETLVGTPFRLHGRDPAHGLDCVGLVASALSSAGITPARIPPYGLRNVMEAEMIAQFALESGLSRVEGPAQPGDILLVQPGPAQAHLLVAAPHGRFVHAHAGLRRVVATPGLPDHPVLFHWRPTAKG